MNIMIWEFIYVRLHFFVYTQILLPPLHSCVVYQLNYPIRLRNTACEWILFFRIEHLHHKFWNTTVPCPYFFSTWTEKWHRWNHPSTNISSQISLDNFDGSQQLNCAHTSCGETSTALSFIWPHWISHSCARWYIYETWITFSFIETLKSCRIDVK